MTGKKAKAGPHHIGRSAGPEDVRPGWLMESAVRCIGPYIEYPNGVVTDRRSGEVLWRPGDDPAKRPHNPEPEKYDKPHNPGYFGGRGLRP